VFKLSLLKKNGQTKSGEGRRRVTQTNTKGRSKGGDLILIGGEKSKCLYYCKEEQKKIEQRSTKKKNNNGGGM